MARLLDITATAAYLSLSARFVRVLVGRGVLRPVRVGRRLLFDVRDLDDVVERWKRESSPEPHAGLSHAALVGWKSSPVRCRKKGAAA